MDNEFVEEKSKGKLVAIILLILGILLVIFGSAYYFFVMRLAPDKYINELSDKTTSYVTQVFDTFSNLKLNTDMKTIKTNGKMSFESNSEDLSFLKDYSYEFNFINSLEEEKLNLELNLLETDKSLLKGNIYLDKNISYLDIKDLYPKVIELSRSNNNIFEFTKDLLKENYTLEDLQIVLESYLKYSFEALKESSMKTENISLSEVKNTYEFTSSNVKKIQDKFQELCKNDKELQSIINDDSSNLLAEGLIGTKIEVTINRFSNEIQKIIITSDSNKTEIVKEEKGKYRINSEDLIILDDNNLTYEDYTDEVLTNTLKITKDKDSLKVSLTIEEGNLELELQKVSKDDAKITLNLNTDTGSTLKFEADLKEVDETIKADIVATIADSDIEIKVKGDITASYTDEKVPTIDTSNAIKLEDLTDSDMESISTKLMEILLDSKLGDLFMQNTDF